MEHLLEIGVFTGKALVIVVAMLVIITAIATAALRAKGKQQHLEIEILNEKFKNFREALSSAVFEKKELKSEKKVDKKKTKSEKKNSQKKRRVFVLDFVGDIKAHAVDHFRDEVTAVLSIAEKGDEVVVCIESPGGMVHTYGLAAAQMLRLKNAGLKVTAAVDKVAASGGYLMACTGDQIIASPFAVVGSIGVLAQIPNINRLLKKHDVDFQEITAGEYKRTLSLMGEITEKGKAKFTEQIEDVHNLFKEFVAENRPVVDVEKVGTGEPWYGKRALDLKLIDQIITSDDYLFGLKDEAKLVSISFLTKKKLGEKLSDAMGKAATMAADRIWTRIQEPKL